MTKNKNTPNFLQGLKKMECLSEDNVPVISLNTSFGQIKSFSFGELSEFRFRTLLTKEPETITWINSFMKDSVFWDIGANIGIYSLYASLIEGIKVVSFEPSSFNYFLLNKNIFLNNKDKNIQALNIAFSDVNCLDIFYLQSAEVSYAENSFALEKDSYGEELHSVYRQDCLGFTVDNFIKQYNMKIPNYIKIDVDGIENLILQGAADTLLADSLRSVSIEVNEALKDQVDQICNIMKKSGYKNVIKRHPPYYDDHYYKPFFNYHFFKE